MQLVTPAIGLLFWMLVTFSLLLFILKKFAWKPILESSRNREQTIEDSLSLAEKTKSEMIRLQGENESLLAEARKERNAMLKEAREMKEKMIADSKSEAQAQGLKMIEQAKAAIETEKNAAMAELKSQVSTLSLAIAEKLLQDELANKDSQVKLVEKMLGDAKLN